MVAFDMDRSIRSSLWCRYLCNTNTSLPGTSTDKIDKLQLDRLLVERGLVESRERGQAMIIADQVLVNSQKEEKSSRLILLTPISNPRRADAL